MYNRCGKINRACHVVSETVYSTTSCMALYYLVLALHWRFRPSPSLPLPSIPACLWIGFLSYDARLPGAEEREQGREELVRPRWIHTALLQRSRSKY